MIDNFQIYPLIVEPMKNTLINGDEKPLDTIPDQFTDRYTLYNLDLEHIGFFGKVYYHDTKLFKEYMSIYTSKLNTININELGNYFAGVLEHEYDKGNDYILHVDILCNIGNFSHDDDNGKTEVYVHFPRTFLITKHIRNKMNISVKCGNNELEHPNSISEYFREELVKPILGV